jgi:hypothetical protein
MPHSCFQCVLFLADIMCSLHVVHEIRAVGPTKSVCPYNSIREQLEWFLMKFGMKNVNSWFVILKYWAETKNLVEVKCNRRTGSRRKRKIEGVIRKRRQGGRN